MLTWLFSAGFRIKASAIRVCRVGNHRNSCWNLTLFHNLHRFFHKTFPQALKFSTRVLVYINILCFLFPFSLFLFQQNNDDNFFFVRKFYPWQPCVISQLSPGLSTACGSCGRMPLYIVFVGCCGHKSRKHTKKCWNFLKKGIDFIENIGIIG